MSRFFNFNSPYIARLYDSTRTPMGVDIIAGLLHVYCRKQLKVCKKILEIPSGIVYSMEWSHGLVSWIGAMELNIGVEFWRGFLEPNFWRNRKLNMHG